MPQALLWPREVLPFRGLSPNFRERSRSGGPSLAGTEAVITTGAGVWMASGTCIVSGRDAVLTWRALAAKLRGRVQPVLVPFCDLRPPFPTIGGSLVTGYEPSPHDDDDAPFDDDTGYAQAAVVATVAAPAALGATSVTLSLISAGAIQPGHHFSIGGRLYRIREGFAEAGATNASFTIAPALRATLVGGEVAEFDHPECLMRLAGDEALDLDLDLGRFATPSVSFVEYF